MNPAPTHGGVRILARLPATFGEIGIRSTHVGPSGRCVVVYDRAAWDAWDAACWDAQGRYVGAADPETRYPDPVMDCMRGGPGALAAWQGAEAEALVGWLADQDEELLVRVHWAAFCREADDETSALWADVAGAVAATEFSGFGDLYRREPRWRGWIHSRAAGSAAMPGWTLASGLSRIRHLPIVLGVLDRLGVRVPQDLPIEADGLAATRQAASDLLSRRGTPPLRPETPRGAGSRRPALAVPPPLTAEEDMADAMVGYDHDLGESGVTLCGRSGMMGHNGGPPPED